METKEILLPQTDAIVLKL